MNSSCSLEIEQSRAEPPSLRGRSIKSGATALSGSQFIRRLARVFLLLAIARVIGPSQFGLYALLLTITEMVFVISGTGYGDYLTREVAANPDQAAAIAFGVTELRICYVVIGTALALALLKISGYQGFLFTGAALLSVSLLPRAVTESCQGVLRGRHMLWPMPWLESVQAGLLVATSAALLYAGYGLLGVIWAEIVAAVVTGGVAVLFVRKLYSFGNYAVFISSFAEIAKLAKRTAAFNCYPFIINAYDRLDVFVLSKLRGNFAVGIYGVPYRIFAGLQILPYGVLGALLPVLCEKEWSAEHERKCSHVMGFLYACALVAILGAMLLSSPVLRLVLGAQYNGSATALKILIWATVPVFMNAMLNTILLANRKEKLFLVTASVCTVFNLVLNVVLIPLFSFKAAAVVTVMTESLLLAQNIYFVKKTVGKTPVPDLVWQVTLGFSAVLTTALLSLRFLSEAPVGFCALAIYLIFLQRIGVLQLGSYFRRTSVNTA